MIAIDLKIYDFITEKKRSQRGLGKVKEEDPEKSQKELDSRR